VAGSDPTGAALLPPAWLGEIRLPLEVLPAGTVLHRVHRLGHGPIFFGPDPGTAPTNRFDPTSGRFGVLYAGLTLEAAIAETLLRNPQRRLVDLADLEARAATELTLEAPARVVGLLGPNLSLLGTDAAIASGPYGPCGAWADALHDHADRPAGLLYPSRHDQGLCCALFEGRAELAAGPPRGLAAELAAAVGAILDRHGKGLDPG
jgi:hypothetical protein